MNKTLKATKGLQVPALFIHLGQLPNQLTVDRFVSEAKPSTLLTCQQITDMATEFREELSLPKTGRLNMSADSTLPTSGKQQDEIVSQQWFECLSNMLHEKDIPIVVLVGSDAYEEVEAELRLDNLDIGQFQFEF